MPRNENHSAPLFSRRTFVFAAQILADLLALICAVGAAGLLAWLINETFLHERYLAFGDENLKHRVLVWTSLSVSLCIWFGITGTYTSRKPLQDDMKQVVGSLFVLLMIDGFFQFVSRENFSRLWILLVWPSAVVLMPIARITIRRVLDVAGIWRIGSAVLGSGVHYASVEHSLVNDVYVGYYVAYHAEISGDSDTPLSTIAAKLSSDMRLRKAETVILVPDDTEMGEAGRIIDALNMNLIPYVLIPPIHRLPFSGLTIQSIINSDAILMSARNGLLSPIRQAAKRGFDIIVGAMMLLFLAPLFIMLYMLLVFGGGAPIYGHVRVGRSGKTFRCLKFRSMVRNSDQVLAALLASDPEAAREWQQNFKLEKDPRITPIGKFLRKSSLDELPQLLNVLRGDMSLVGPRPVVAQELQKYYGEDVFYYALVRPGLTGLWQVSGRSRTTYGRRVFLDSWYVRNWSLWTDIVILFNTVPSVLARDGAV